MRVVEIFRSISGETNGHMQGRVTAFVRLAGCNLRCSYCDTPESQKLTNGKKMYISQIVKEVDSLNCDYVCITGGEPLLQKETLELCKNLSGKKYYISVETNNTIDIKGYLPYVSSFILDFKIQYWSKMLFSNIIHIRPQDIVKIVITKKDDFERAYDLVSSVLPSFKKDIKIALSPCSPDMKPEKLADMIINSDLRSVILSVQLHKYLGIR